MIHKYDVEGKRWTRVDGFAQFTYSDDTWGVVVIDKPESKLQVAYFYRLGDMVGEMAIAKNGDLPISDNEKIEYILSRANVALVGFMDLYALLFLEVTK